MTRVLKKSLIFLLVLALSLTFSTVFALNDGCGHTVYYTTNGEVYTHYDRGNIYGHERYDFQDMFCTLCGTDFTVFECTVEPHTFDMASDEWTGNHYHSGNQHYYEFYAACFCGFISPTETVWLVNPCLGNGSHCAMPWNIDIPVVSE